MGVREIERFLKQWQMELKDSRRRTILAPTPRKRGRRHALWLLAQGWTASAIAEAVKGVGKLGHVGKEYLSSSAFRLLPQGGVFGFESSPLGLISLEQALHGTF